jgi:hypothetical protein
VKSSLTKTAITAAYLEVELVAVAIVFSVTEEGRGKNSVNIRCGCREYLGSFCICHDPDTDGKGCRESTNHPKFRLVVANEEESGYGADQEEGGYGDVDDCGRI